jgi:hypothetical protein
VHGHGITQEPANENGVAGQTVEEDWAHRKLKAEAELAEREFKDGQRTRSLQFVTALVPGLSVLVAVSGLLVGTLSQRAGREEDEFLRLTERLTTTHSPVTQLGAISGLRPYWKNGAYRTRIAELAMSMIGAERDPTVRQALLEELTRVADTPMLDGLARQNRLFQQRVRSRLAHADRSQLALDLAFPVSRDPRDSAFWFAYEDLAWNVAAIVRCLNRMKHIGSLDLSDVTFSIVLGPSEGDVWSDPPEELAPGLVFDHTDLHGASFAGLALRSVVFRSANLDSVLLAASKIEHSSLVGNTSLAGFRTALEYVHMDSTAVTAPPEKVRIGTPPRVIFRQRVTGWIPLGTPSRIVDGRLVTGWIPPNDPVWFVDDSLALSSFFTVPHPETANYGDEVYAYIQNTTWSITGPRSNARAYPGVLIVPPRGKRDTLPLRVCMAYDRGPCK